ncbi:MAG: DUF6273 domain-containing protein, partial [Treponema porcinum]|uniref:DUF6273 domain-containing protein n=1 Tax=Treponema porcinum TaxID=261392 RepID=UPI002A810C5C
LYNPREINGNEIQPNNYEFSEVRAFLNGLNGESYGVSDFSEKGFFDIAFSEEEKKSILTSKIDNSLNSTTDYTGTWKKAYGYASNDTEDKIFLLSEYEITNPSYGFKNYDERDVYKHEVTLKSSVFTTHYITDFFYEQCLSSSTSMGTSAVPPSFCLNIRLVSYSFCFFLYDKERMLTHFEFANINLLPRFC